MLLFIMKALKRAAACSLSLFTASSVISILLKLTNCHRIVKFVYICSAFILMANHQTGLAEILAHFPQLTSVAMDYVVMV